LGKFVFLLWPRSDRQVQRRTKSLKSFTWTFEHLTNPTKNPPAGKLRDHLTQTG
jgi:hypothetical protein